MVRRDKIVKVSRANGIESFAVLAKAVNDNDFNVRVGSIGTLKALGPAAEAAIPALETALKDKD